MGVENRLGIHIPTCSELLARVLPIMGTGRTKDIKVDPKPTALSPVKPNESTTGGFSMTPEEEANARIEAAKQLYPK